MIDTETDAAFKPLHAEIDRLKIEAKGYFDILQPLIDRVNTPGCTVNEVMQRVKDLIKETK